MTSAIGLPTATQSPPLPRIPLSSKTTPLIPRSSQFSSIASTTHARMVTCAAATASVVNDEEISEEEMVASRKVGSMVRVKVPLKVYHVAKVPELDITGREGVVKQYVGIWKGKRISANLPFKVEFEMEVEGRGKVKFFAHLREDEFELVD